MLIISYTHIGMPCTLAEMTTGTFCAEIYIEIILKLFLLNILT